MFQTNSKKLNGMSKNLRKLNILFLVLKIEFFTVTADNRDTFLRMNSVFSLEIHISSSYTSLGI